MLTRLARLRVPLGFLCAALTLGLARPSWRSWSIGLVVACVGELLRVWAAGHIEKGREITQSGPYRFVRHPLYLGSVLLGVGFSIASANALVAGVAGLYLSITLLAAIRTEEATLDKRFDGAYSQYRTGSLARVDRPFAWQRVMANREYRALAGLAAAFAVLVIRILA